jgi:5-(carboxyamino)imidazole ribonucleotide synthase
MQAMLERFDYRGVLTIEFFATANGLVANEIAPRVHNSGHWTIEGAETSQFENHLRGILGLPLGATAPRGVAAMRNLIGRMPPREALLGIEGLHLHDYGKAPRPGRKLGHCTLLAPDRAAAVAGLSSLDAALAASDA